MSRPELWRVMTGRKSTIPTDRMKWGSDNEYRAVAVVEAFQGIMYSQTGKAQKTHFLDAEGYKLRATPDGVFTDTTGYRSGLETKCPERLHEEVRPYIIAQVQIQAFVCDLAEITVCEWTYQGNRIWNVEPSSEYIDAARPLLTEFAGYVRDDKEPPRLGRAPVMPAVNVTMMHEELLEDVPF